MSDKPLYASDVVIGGVSLAELAEQLKNYLEIDAAKIKDFTESRKSRERQAVEKWIRDNAKFEFIVRISIPTGDPERPCDEVSCVVHCLQDDKATMEDLRAMGKAVEDMGECAVKHMAKYGIGRVKALR